MKITKRDKWLIAMCWLLYTGAYLGRYSYNTNILPLSLHYGQSEDSIALATTFFFFAYGAGQIVNGILCKHYPMRYVLSAALAVSAAVNLAIFCGAPFASIKYLWLINGMAQSVLWSSIMLTLSRHLDKGSIGKAIVAMSTTASVGTLTSYGLSALLAMWGGFRFSFLISALVMLTVGGLWFVLYGRVTADMPDQTRPQATAQKGRGATDPAARRYVICTLAVFGCVAVIINLVKDGLLSWVPSMLYDTYGLGESLSIFVTLALPVLAIFGTGFVVALHKRIKSHALLMGIVFALATALVALVLGLFETPHWYLTLGVLALTSLLMSGANNIATSIIPLELRDKANSGFVAGMINGCCYVGSTLSQIGLALVASNLGWKAVFDVFLWAGLGVVAICAVAIFALPKKEKSHESAM